MSETAEFDAFYGQARRGILVQALVTTGDPLQAARATVGVFEDAWRSWGRVRRDDDPAAWARRRLHGRAPSRGDAEAGTEPPAPDEEQQALLATFAGLTADQRRAWALVEVAGLSQEAAAAESDLGSDAFATALEAARKKLRFPTGSHATDREDAPDAPVHMRAQELPGPGPGSGDPPARESAHGDPDHVDHADHPGHGSDDPWTTHDVLVVLDDLARRFTLPAPPQLRSGRRGSGGGSLKSLVRLGAAAAVVVLVAGGAYAVVTELDDGSGPAIPSGDRPGGDRQAEVPASALLAAGGLADLGRGDWQESATTADPGNTGPGSVCQQAGSPDPAALGVQERRFESSSAAAQETLTVSRSSELAEAAYDRTVGWWSACTGRTVLLQGSYASDVGDESLILTLRDWSEPTASYTVALGRAGAANVSIVSVDPTAAAPSPPEQLPGTPQEAADALARALAAACELEAATCDGAGGGDATVQRVAPPSPAGSRGLLSTVDLPPPGDLSLAWSASPPVAADGEIRPTDTQSAVTPCDDLAFGEEGARNVYTRTFEVPGDPDLPSYFGLAETVGTFDTDQRASEVVDAVVDRFDSCASRLDSARVAAFRRDLSDEVGSPEQPVSESAVWGLGYDQEDSGRVFVRTAVVRNGRAVARVTFTPGPQNDMTPEQFAVVVTRATARLADTQDAQLPS